MHTRTADIKLVAIDLDGTLLNSSKKVSDQTAAALRCLRERGVRVVIASARPPRSVRHIYELLALDGLQINYNGALIWDQVQGRAAFHRPMGAELVRQIIDFARRLHADVLVSCEILDRWCTDRADQTYTTETGRLFKPDVVAPVESFCVEPITKLMFLGHPATMKVLEPAIGERFARSISIVRTDDDLIQIMHRRVGKSRALKLVARWYGIKPQQIMAIGDAPNDVGMLQIAGVAVAMDNAHSFVKEVAHWIAPSNDDHGVYAALVRYGLCD